MIQPLEIRSAGEEEDDSVMTNYDVGDVTSRLGSLLVFMLCVRMGEGEGRSRIYKF